ncbi:MAG TPA: T9SS type A sorting domain-containing protein [Flavobacteriales bacterium]|nr:T9SS type A sorting domain-containing protein [Flavobacteriales bacterium]
MGLITDVHDVLSNELTLVAHPNPSHGQLHVQGEDGAFPIKVIVSDALGRSVRTTTIRGPSDILTIHDQGIYFLMMTNDHGTFVNQQVVVQ